LNQGDGGRIRLMHFPARRLPPGGTTRSHTALLTVAKPAHLVDAVLAIQGTEYIAYLADGRELSDATAGQPIGGPVRFRLSAGTYKACLYSPTEGLYSPGVGVQGDSDVTIELPPFEYDVVLQVTREH